jgi:hypothetical protein
MAFFIPRYLRQLHAQALSGQRAQSLLCFAASGFFPENALYLMDQELLLIYIHSKI